MAHSMQTAHRNYIVFTFMEQALQLRPEVHMQGGGNNHAHIMVSITDANLTL